MRFERPETYIRPAPSGPGEIWCIALSAATGCEITKAKGSKTRKYRADSAAKVNALRRVKKKLGRRWNANELRLVYKELPKW